MHGTDLTAETILQKLQQVLIEAGGDTPEAGQTRTALKTVERTHGAQATRYGRLLHDLVNGSHAWDLFEEPQRGQSKSRGPSLPRIHALCVCEPLLQIMRDSGELTERERLLKERDSGLAALWRREGQSEESRWLETEAIHDAYFVGVAQTTDTFRVHYEALRSASGGRVAPLVGPRVRSRLLLQPPLMALLFQACHSDALPGAREHRQGGNAVQVLPAAPLPLITRDSDADQAALQAWAGPQKDASLDPMVWDLAALAVSAFYVRTDGADFDASFPFLIEDYFLWRGIDPRKRSKELREQIGTRLEMLCSNRIQVRSETSLWLTDPATGRRKKTPVVAEGPFLVKRSRFFRKPSASGENDEEAIPETAGYLLSLGEWARKFVEERAMLGIHLKRLGEYDLNRQQWERRIGWYLVFQMNNQASKMTFDDVVKDGKTRTSITPQHPLKMKTVLDNSHVAWEEIGRTNPGKVIKQWCDALETLRKDGVIGPSPCLDGAADGSDLPVRGRLNAMLERRYQFVPGRDLLPHLRAKRGAAERKRAG